MSYIVFSDYFDEFYRTDTYDEAVATAKSCMLKQGEDNGMGSGCDVEIHKRVAVVSGEISVNIEITQEVDDVESR